MSVKVELSNPESVDIKLNMGQVMFENQECTYAVQVNGKMHIQSNGIINLPSYYTQDQSDTLNADFITSGKVKTMVLDIFFPVGTIYMSANSINPSTTMGGTWIAWGDGRVPVGVDTAQTEFNTVEKTGGNKNLQAHTHMIGGANLYYTAGGELSAFAKEGGMSINFNTNSTGTGNSQNLQPYITCYMWKRTA